jgi:hypothetical protein
MGFPDIDFDELDLAAKFLVKVVETHGPLNIGRSGKTSKYQSNGFFPPEIAQPDSVFAADIAECKIRSRISNPGSEFIVAFLPGGSLLAILNCLH